MTMKTIVQQYITAYNSFDIQGMLSCFLETAIFENISNSSGSITVQGIDEIKNLANKSTELFRSREQKILRLHQGDQHIVIEVLYTAILDKDLSGNLKKGDLLNLKGVSIFEFKNNKISRLVDYS